MIYNGYKSLLHSNTVSTKKKQDTILFIFYQSSISIPTNGWLIEL